MNSDSEAVAQLRRAVADLVGTAQSSLPPAEKLDLLCVQIGTAQYWLDQLHRQADPGHELAGPHFVTRPQPSPIP
jgi:hypothetical protein